MYKILLKLIYYCNIRFFYWIKKVIKNNSINILDYKRKNHEMKHTRYTNEAKLMICGLRCVYKERRNEVGYFENLIIVSLK